MLATVDYLKPDLAAPLVKPQLTLEQIQEEAKKPAPLKSFQHFKKARKTTEEMYNEISNNANININTWMNLVGKQPFFSLGFPAIILVHLHSFYYSLYDLGASTMAAGGLTTNVLVFTVAAMLVSPIMGPILGMVMGYRVADFTLFRTGFLNEVKMAMVTYLTGCFYGTMLGDVGKTYKWPNSQMMHEGMAFNLVISIIVSAAAGMVLGISMTAAGGNALVGTAISAGLLPPLVNAGMLHAYATFYVTDSIKRVRFLLSQYLSTIPFQFYFIFCMFSQSLFYQIGTYSVLFYATHVITIVIVANFVFYLKDVDPRFREGEDANIQLLTDHRKTLTEREKAEMFIGNIKADLKKDVKVFTEGVKDFFTGNISIGREGIVNRRTGESSRSKRSRNRQYNSEYESIQEGDEEDDYHHDDDDVENRGGHLRHYEHGHDDGSYEDPNTVANPMYRPQSQPSSSSAASMSAVTAKSVREPHYMSTTAAAAATSSAATDEELGGDYLHVEPASTTSSSSSPSPSKPVNRTGDVEMTRTTSSSSAKLVKNNSNNYGNNNPARERVVEFYRRYNPGKLASVDEILSKYEGKEDELLRKLRKQYNV